MRIARNERFKKAWSRLIETDRKPARKAIENLAANINYPSLKVKKMGWTKAIWEARAGIAVGITFEISKDLMVLRNIGRHDDVLKQP